MYAPPYPLKKRRVNDDNEGLLLYTQDNENKNWSLACENLLEELIWNKRVRVYKEIIFNQDLTNILCKKYKKLW